MDNRRCLIDERIKEERRRIIQFLEDMGFSLEAKESRNKKEIIESFLPIYVDKTDKNYWMMGNVTCAAAAASSNKMIRKEAFYEWMKD